MSKTTIPGVTYKKDSNGNKISKKRMSHGSYRCKRKPNSPECLNGSYT
jgi:hypothetical protein